MPMNHLSPEVAGAYNSWIAMRHRCGPTSKGKIRAAYHDAGIRVCTRWDSFANFLADMGPRPAGTSIDRFPDGRGNYEPGNCRWATASEQVLNRAPFKTKARKPIEWMGRSQALRQWEKELGCVPGCLESRMARGWSVEKTMTTPFKRR
jgi:hypothetical protein